MNQLEQTNLKREAARKLWHRGVLSWKFDGYPWARQLYEFIRSKWGVSPHIDAMVHRRGAKSTTGLIVGVEEALRAPNIRCAVLCTTKEQARDVCEESMVAILDDCPKDIMPRRVKNDFTWVFDHNGSKIQILSADKLNNNSGRGRKFRWIHVMEAGHIPNLGGILKSVLSPTLRDVTGRTTGTMYLESTPPIEEEHDFEKLWIQAQLDGRAFFLPLSANKWASPDFVKAAQDDCGGPLTEEYLREYELRFGTGKNKTAIPEFTPEKQQTVVRVVDRPLAADRYAVLDPGGEHPTGELWGFYDFEKDLLVIEHEWLGENVTTDVIASMTKEKELELGWDRAQGKLTRIADNNNVILLRDLQKDHKLLFHATQKDDKDAQVNKTRVMFRDNRIAIHPRCEILIKTLRIAKRSKIKRKSFLEMEDIGHADLLDCLLYMVRNLKKHVIPEPEKPVPAGLEQIRQPEPVNPAKSLARQLSKARWKALRSW